jgi:acetyltransferase-like isoleucine patch superfamily enzyme
VSFVWRLLDPLLLRLRNRLEHLALHEPSARFERELRALATLGPNVRLGPTAGFDATDPARIVIGDYSYIRGEIGLLSERARVSIGDHAYVGPESRIMAQESIRIGSFVLIAHLVDVHDNNSHSLDWRERREDAVLAFERRAAMRQVGVTAAPIVIEDDVWIGAKSTILKGVTIGRGAVVAANSVVTKDVAPFTLVAGNPAQTIRELPR